MRRMKKCTRSLLACLGMTLGVPLAPRIAAQEAQKDRTQDATANPEGGRTAREVAAGSQPADGGTHGLPIETFAVTPGTRVLIRLEDSLSTKETRENSRFRARTMEPLEAGSGIYLPAGAEIRGHVSRVIPASVAGRAKIWLTFDEIRTKFGTLPIVADIVSVPGDHTVRVKNAAEGAIEGSRSTQQAAGEAAGEGAAMGAMHGVKHHDAKEAVEGAAMAALEAYLAESGRGHELNLPKGAKLELELERTLYLVRD